MTAMFSNTRTLRIEWGDCDPAGIVFYPRYFAMFDTSTTELMEAAIGMSKFDYLKAFNFIGHPIVETRAIFRIPNRFGDEVSIETAVAALRQIEHQDRASPDQSGRAVGRGLRDARFCRSRSGRSGAHEGAADPARVCRAADAWQIAQGPRPKRHWPLLLLPSRRHGYARSAATKREMNADAY